MGFLNKVWRKLTPTRALENTSGKLELAFFENVYRVIYLAGLSTSDKGLFYTLYSTTVKLIMTVFVLSELWCVWDATSLDGVIDIFNVTLIHLISVYRYWMLTKYKHIYAKLATATESPLFDISSPRRQLIVQYWIDNNEQYFKLLLALGTCTLAAWYLYPFLDDVDYNLVVAVKVPYNYATSRRYGITYITVVIFFHYTSYFVMVNDLIMQAHLMHLLSQFDVLRDCFENIIADCSEGIQGLDESNLHKNEVFIQKYLLRLGDLVKQHKFILSNTSELRRILSLPMLAQLATSSMLICFAAYQVTVVRIIIITAFNSPLQDLNLFLKGKFYGFFMSVREGITKFLMSLLYLGYNMFELFIFCRWCDEIKVQKILTRSILSLRYGLPTTGSKLLEIPENIVTSERISLAVYSSGWERLAMVPGVRARLMVIAARAGRPLVLTAGGLYDLSLNSYATLVKTSYSALTVLLRTQHE